MPIVYCEVCKKELHKYQSQINNSSSKRFFCSKECRSKYRAKQVKKEKFICKNCNKEFYRTLREIKNHKRNNSNINFCCKKCMLEYNHVDTVKINCTYCNKELTKRITDVGQKNFCNWECYKKYFNEKNEKNIIELECKNCGKKFKIDINYIKSQNKRDQQVVYCSKECMFEYLKRNQIEVICDMCNKNFLKNKEQVKKNEKNFCSNECRLNYYNKFHRVVTKCDNCGKKISIKKSSFDNATTHFCDKKCFDEYRTSKKEVYEEIAHYLRSCDKYKKWRRDVLKKDNYKCCICNSKENLQVHHIEELYKICLKYNFIIDDIENSYEFNDILNGITLCKKCHTKIHPQLNRDEKGRFCRLVSTATEDTRLSTEN